MVRPLHRYQLLTDLTVAAVFLLFALAVEWRASSTTAVEALGAVLVAVGMAGALAVRRLSPALALAVAWAAGLLQMGFGRAPSLSDLALFAVLYASAAYGSRRVFWCGFASAILGAAVGTAYLALGLVGAPPNVGRIDTAAAVLLAALVALLLAWTAGALVRTALTARANHLAQERAEADAAVEAERVRIARDMHDVVAHSLAVVVAQADGARYAAAHDPGAASNALETISTTARSALADVRLLLTQLRHSEGKGPQPMLADLEELYAQVRAAGLTVRVQVDPAPTADPSAAVQLAVYRILQEALTNALRHGNGGPVELCQQWQPDRVEIIVRNGAGSAPASAGHGILGMRERAQVVGGSLDAGAEGGAFVVRASIPIGAGG